GDMKIFTRVLSGDIPSPRTVNPNVSPKLEAICMRALSFRREDRFQNALEMQAALEEVIDDLGARVTSREVARYVSERFAEERAAMRAAVDAQLREMAKVSESQQVAPI